MPTDIVITADGLTIKTPSSNRLNVRRSVLLMLFCSHVAVAEQPFNTTGFIDDIAIGGFDPVSYFSSEVSRTLKPTRGQQRFLVPYQGVDFYFSIEENAKRFMENPGHFLPKYNGFCAYALASEGRLLKPSGKIWGIYENRLYLFYSHQARRDWEATDWRELIITADNNWATFEE